MNHHGREADLVSRRENVQVQVSFISEKKLKWNIGPFNTGAQEEIQGGCNQEDQQKTPESPEVLQLLYHPCNPDHLYCWLLHYWFHTCKSLT